MTQEWSPNMAQKSLFNLNRLVADSGKDVSPEASFLLDLDYTIRKMNEYKVGYYFKKITDNTEKYLDTKQENSDTYKRVDIVCVIDLPEPNKENCYENSHIVYHTNDNEYYVCMYSDGKPSRTYKPSSMKCIRNMYYQVIGADQDKQSSKTSDFYGICDSGTDRHERIQNAISKMKEYGVDCEFVDVVEFVKENNLPLTIQSKKDYEVKLYDEKRNIVFLCDGIIKYRNTYYIIEIKTESSYKWMDRKAMDPEHRVQAYTYSLEFGIDKVIFIYENRDFCTKKSFLVNVTDENRQYIENRITICQSYVEKKTPPPIETDITKHICQYCDYKTICRVDNK